MTKISKAATPLGDPSTQAKDSPAAVLDADLLDDYFIRVLLQSFLADLKPIRLPVPWTASSLLVPLARSITILACGGQTPALRLLGVKRVARRRTVGTARSRPTSDLPPPFRLGVFAILSTILPIVYQRLKMYWKEQKPHRLQQLIQSRTWSDDELTSSSQSGPPPGRPTQYNNTTGGFVATSPQELAWQRRERLGDLVIKLVDKIVPVLQLAALLKCWSGRSSTPSAAMLLSGLAFEDSSTHESSPNATRTLSVDYAHRRWLYQQLTRTARVLWIGLAMTDTWRPLLEEPWQRIQAKLLFIRERVQMHMTGARGPSSLKENARIKADVLTKCLICHERPIVLPVQANCRCRGTYCYICLYHLSRRRAGRLRSPNRAVRCISCDYPITKARFL